VSGSCSDNGNDDARTRKSESFYAAVLGFVRPVGALLKGTAVGSDCGAVANVAFSPSSRHHRRHRHSLWPVVADRLGAKVWDTCDREKLLILR